VLGGAGVAIVPRLSVQRELDEGRLVHLLPGHIAPGVSLFLLHRGGRFLRTEGTSLRRLRSCGARNELRAN
jgi:DNA-binding transcriptional LysR family regulator